MYYDYDFIAGLIVVPFLIGLAVGIVWYVLEALGVYEIAKGRGYKNAWLAFIPVANAYVLGGISDNINLFRGKKSNMKVWLLVTNIVQWIAVIPMTVSVVAMVAQFAYYMDETALLSSMLSLMTVSAVISLVSIAALVFRYIACYKIFSDYAPNNAVLYIVLSIILPFLASIFLFVVRRAPAISLSQQMNQQFEQPFNPQF